METVFKVGMKVYDQVFFGKTPLKITEVKEDMSLRVLCGEVTYCYTGDGRFIGDDITSNRWRGLSQTPTLSTSPYTLQGFEQKEAVPTLEDALDWLENNKNYQTVFEDERTYPSKEIYEAFEALRKLIILRDYYNEGWQPDWTDKKNKFCIEVENGKPRLEIWNDRSRVLTFKSHEIAYNFLEEQKELLEIAKPLL